MLTIVSTARQGNAGAVNTKTLQRTFHNHRVLNDFGDDLVSITLAILYKEVKSEVYPCTLKTTDEVKKNLWDMVDNEY